MKRYTPHFLAQKKGSEHLRFEIFEALSLLYHFGFFITFFNFT